MLDSLPASDFAKPKYNGGIISNILVQNFLNTLIHFVLRLEIKTHFLEVGSGEGQISSLLHKLGFQIYGIDNDEERVKFSKKNNPKIKFIKDDIFKHKRLKKIDLVLCLEVLEHIKEYNLAIEKIHKLTDKYAIISVPNEPIWRILNFVRGKYIFSLGNTPGHLNNWTSKEISEKVKRKFNIIDIKTPLPWTMLLCEKK